MYRGRRSSGGGGGGGYNRQRGRGGRGGGNWGRGSFRGQGGPVMETHEGDDGEPSSGTSFGRGRGGRGRPPPHLRGKDIGLWYRDKGIVAKEQQNKEALTEMPVMEVDTGVADLLCRLIPELDKTLDIGDSKLSTCAFSAALMEINKATPLPDVDVTFSLPANPTLDQLLMDHLVSLERSNYKYQRFLEFRKKLPAFDCKDIIVKAVSENQVIVISGETGCGKTTQVAQYILDSMIAKGCGSLCNILCTQPRRISAVSVAERVAEERCERVGDKSVGYVIRLDSKRPTRQQGTIVYCTTGVVFQYLKDDPFLKTYTHIILDEVHERDANCDILITILRDLLRIRKDLKIILMSATINPEHFATYFNDAPMLSIPGLTFPVTDFYLEDIIEKLRYKFPIEEYAMSYNRGGLHKRHLEDLKDIVRRTIRSTTYSPTTINEMLKPDTEDFRCLMDVAKEILCRIAEDDPQNGAVLIFVTGWDEISKLNSYLQESGHFPPNSYLILPLHSMMPTTTQRQIFDRPPPGIRKIIISTNIAETSITIDDVVHVIDFGKIKLTSFDINRNVESLDSHWCSKANVKQRRGRAGRVQQGYCYHLYSKGRMEKLDGFLIPEVRRKRLEEIILQMKLLKLGNMRQFLKRLPDPPVPQAVDLSFERLRVLHAIDEDENLTPLGYHLSRLPLHPQTGKMLLMAAVFSVVDPVLSLAASLSFKDPFVVPLGKEAFVDRIRRDFADGSKSDHWAIIQAIDGYERAVSRGYEKDYCFRNFLSPSTCKLLVDFKKQFCEHLCNLNFLTSTNYKELSFNCNSANRALVKAVIFTGLYPNIAAVRLKGKRGGPPFPVCRTLEDGTVYIHKKSVNAEERDFQFPFVVYHVKQKLKKIMLFDTTMISPYPVIFFAGEPVPMLRHNIRFFEIDGLYQFKMLPHDLSTVKTLRLALDKILAGKITHPTPTDWNSSSVETQLLKAMRELITTQYRQIMQTDDLSQDSGSDEESQY